MYLEIYCAPNEVWKRINIEGVQSKYLVSDCGRVKNDESGKILKQAYDKYGYKIISLQMNDYSRRTFKVHRLVLLSFVGEHPTKTTVNHKNGVKDDNSLYNLEWMDIFEQQRHAIKIGLKKFNKGNNAPNVVYDSKIIDVICKLISEDKKPAQISEVTGLPNNKKLHSLIYRIRSGRHWGEIYEKYKRS